MGMARRRLRRICGEVPAVASRQMEHCACRAIGNAIGDMDKYKSSSFLTTALKERRTHKRCMSIQLQIYGCECFYAGLRVELHSVYA